MMIRAAMAWLLSLTKRRSEQPNTDEYGNPLDGDRLIYCCFPDCGCDGTRLCMAENGASYHAGILNLEKRSGFGMFKGIDKENRR